MKNIIDVKHLSFSYNHQLVLEDVTFEVFNKDFLALIGPNGGGKTTLLKLILGLIRPKKGEVLLLGNRPEKTRKRVGYVAQHVHFDQDNDNHHKDHQGFSHSCHQTVNQAHTFSGILNLQNLILKGLRIISNASSGFEVFEK